MLRDGKIDDSDLEMITSTIEQNYKYGATLLTISAKKMKKEQAAKEELQQKYIMQQKDADLKIAQTLQQGKAAGVDQNIMTEGKMKAMLAEIVNKGKSQTQSQLLDQRGKNKKEENAQKNELGKDAKTHEANLDEMTGANEPAKK